MARDEDHRVEELVAGLTLEEKASLTAGASVWHLPPLERFGIGQLKMSDGPSGVRGERMGVRRSLSFPCGMAVGATWDVDLVAALGDAVGLEARSKGVHLVLGPTVCIPRMPLGGRTFESFAEDPHLTARLTVAYIRGTQAHGVGCCVKHFACNDQEHERHTISAEVDPVTLREVHLPAFEAAVREAGTWAVMSAYNRLNGTFCGEHPELLGRTLKGEWAFDGVVVSDWFGTHSTADAAIAGLDIEMPGPASHLGPHLVDAVRSGDVSDEIVDEHARQVVRLLVRTGLADSPPKPDEAEDDDPDRRATAHTIAVGSTVLLHNDGILPLDVPSLERVALIGPNARRLTTGGGGSSTVTPLRDRLLLDELRSRFGAVEVVHEEGCRLGGGTPLMDPALIDGGFDVEFHTGGDLDHGFAGDVAGTERLRRADFVAIGDPLPGVPLPGCRIKARTTFVPDADGTWTFGLANTGTAVVRLDGDIIVDNRTPERGRSFFGLGSTVATAEVELAARRPHELVVEMHNGDVPIGGFQVRAGRPPRANSIDRAVAAAREADVAVVVVGANSEVESEGHDRPDLRLAGEQDELVHRVAAANPRTIVVLNVGAPVTMPWIDEVAAVVNVWFPGEEGAAALAEILTGDAEPSGRLPITFPRALAESATHAWYPGAEGKVTYGEGLLVGHRHFDANEIEPLFCFGHGLSYTTFEHDEPVADGDGTDLVVRVPVTNTGSRPGTEVVQLYAGPIGDGGDAARRGDRPVRQLAGFVKVEVEPGATAEAAVAADARAFSRWDEPTRSWTVVPGDYELSVGASSRDLRHRMTVTVPASDLADRG